jgi:tetratricopeptide (TPR) repeat protein
MDNVNRVILANRAARSAGRGARWSRRIRANVACVAALFPTRTQVLLPWNALLTRAQFLAPGFLVLVALIGIVTTLEETALPRTPVKAIVHAEELSRALPPIPGFQRGALLRSTAIDRVYTRPGIAFGVLHASAWGRAALGLPDPLPGQPLAAYTASTTRLSWSCVVLTLLAIAFLPSAVAGARLAHEMTPVTAEGPWRRWRIVTAPFWLLGLGLLPFLALALVAAVPWWVLSLPVARWIAQTTLVAAVVVAVGCRARSPGGALWAGHALALAAALPLVLLVAVLMRWLTGWSAVLPDPEIAGWVEGGLKPILWLLVSGAGARLVLRSAAVSGGIEARGGGPARARASARIQRALTMTGRLVAGFGIVGLVLFGARFAVRALNADGGPNEIQWNEPVTRRQVGQSSTSPPGLRSAFREFGAGSYENVIASERRLAADAATTDDRRLLEAAVALAQGEARQVRALTGAIRSQYGAALTARAAAALRAGGGDGSDPRPGALWSLVDARAGVPAGAPNEAAGLERLIAGLDETQFVVYSPRRAEFLRVPYKLFARPGAGALRIVMLRRLVALRPNDDEARVQLAQTLAEHKRLLTDSSIREIQVDARAGLRGQRETLCHEALALNPRNWEALVVLGRLDEAIKLRPRDAKLRQLRIDKAHESGDFKHLLEDAQQLVALTSSDTARYTLAMARVSTGAVTTGIEELLQLLQGMTAGDRAAALSEEYPAWAVNAALLLAKQGRFAKARTTLEDVQKADALDGKGPLDPRTVLALLRLEAGDRAGARELLRERPMDRPIGGMLPVLADLMLRERLEPRTLRRVNIPSGAIGFGPRFYSWKDEGMAFDLEPIAQAIVRRDPHSLAGRYLLADALASRVEPRPIQQPPTALTRRALHLLFGLTREYPGWIAPLECLSALALRLGHFDRASAYQRIVGELYGDQDRTRWVWRSPGYGGPQFGRPRSGFNGPQPGQPGFLR